MEPLFHKKFHRTIGQLSNMNQDICPVILWIFLRIVRCICQQGNAIFVFRTIVTIVFQYWTILWTDIHTQKIFPTDPMRTCWKILKHFLIGTSVGFQDKCPMNGRTNVLRICNFPLKNPIRLSIGHFTLISIFLPGTLQSSLQDIDPEYN